jgi:hypothetical protein
MATMSAEDNQYSISMSYDTCGEDEADAVRTMLAAIEARSTVFVTIHKDGIDEPVFEDEISAMENRLPHPDDDLDDAEPSRLKPTSIELAIYVDEEEAEALNRGEWRDLDRKMVGTGCYDTDFYEDRIIFAVTWDDHTNRLGEIEGMVREELDRMTGRSTQAKLEELEGFGSF